MNAFPNSNALADDLNELLATENHSLARHLEEATPYLSPRTYPIWQGLSGLGHLSRDHVARLSNLIDELELPPRPRTFASEVASYHFLDLGYLLPKLIEETTAQIASYERAIGHAGDSEPLRAELQSLLESNQRKLEQLRAAVAA